MARINLEQVLSAAERERGRSRFRQARTLFGKAAAASAGLPERAQALQGVADCSRLLGDFPESLQAYRAALKAAPRADAALKADLLCGHALALRGAGKPKPALSGLRKARAAYARLKDPEGEAFCLWALGGTLRIAGELPAGLAELKKARKAWERLGGGEGLAYVHCALGGVYRMLDRPAESLAHYSAANAAMRERKDVFGTAYSYCGLGNAARMRGDLPEALAYFRRAEKVYARIGDRVSFAYTLWSLATAYKLQGRLTEALKAFRRADALFVSTGDRRGRAYVALGYAEIAALQGKRAESPGRLKEARSFARGFAWEARHVRALEALIHGRPADARAAYASSGSRFRPQNLPVNWP
jgi:tetratricopeptide (TPR) repeat protein